MLGDCSKLGKAERLAGRSANKTRNGQATYMRLRLILPVVEAGKYNQAEECPDGCGGGELFLRQEVKKQGREPTRDEEKRDDMSV